MRSGPNPASHQRRVARPVCKGLSRARGVRKTWIRAGRRGPRRAARWLTWSQGLVASRPHRGSPAVSRATGHVPCSAVVATHQRTSQRTARVDRCGVGSCSGAWRGGPAVLAAAVERRWSWKPREPKVSHRAAKTDPGGVGTGCGRRRAATRCWWRGARPALSRRPEVVALRMGCGLSGEPPALPSAVVASTSAFATAPAAPSIFRATDVAPRWSCCW